MISPQGCKTFKGTRNNQLVTIRKKNLIEDEIR